MSYCLKPVEETSEYPSNEPTYDNSISPSLSPKSKIPSSLPSTSETVEITVQPTSIFDVIAESTRFPQRQGDARSSSPNQIVFNDTTVRTDRYREFPIYWRVIICFIVVLLLWWWMSYYWCNQYVFCSLGGQSQQRYFPEQITIRTKTFARTPPADVIVPITDSDDEATASSPTFPVPKIISTTKIMEKNSHINDDEESEIGVYIEDDSVM